MWFDTKPSWNHTFWFRSTENISLQWIMVQWKISLRNPTRMLNLKKKKNQGFGAFAFLLLSLENKHLKGKWPENLFFAYQLIKKISIITFPAIYRRIQPFLRTWNIRIKELRIKHHAKLNLLVTFIHADQERFQVEADLSILIILLPTLYLLIKKATVLPKYSWVKSFLSAQILELNLPCRTDAFFLCNP